MTLPDITHDCPDAEVDYLAQRAEIPLPTRGGQIAPRLVETTEASASAIAAVSWQPSGLQLAGIMAAGIACVGLVVLLVYLAAGVVLRALSF